MKKKWNEQVNYKFKKWYEWNNKLKSKWNYDATKEGCLKGGKEEKRNAEFSRWVIFVCKEKIANSTGKKRNGERKSEVADEKMENGEICQTGMRQCTGRYESVSQIETDR